MITYEVADVAYAFENLSQYWQEHYKEVGMYTDTFPLEIDRTYYEALENAGMLLVIVALSDNSPIGYMVWIVKRHPRYPVVVGIADFYWLHKDYRGKTVAYKMFQYAEEQLKLCGVGRLIANCKVSNPQGRLLVGLGYEHFEESYTKLLKVAN